MNIILILRQLGLFTKIDVTVQFGRAWNFRNSSPRNLEPIFRFSSRAIASSRPTCTQGRGARRGWCNRRENSHNFANRKSKRRHCTGVPKVVDSFLVAHCAHVIFSGVLSWKMRLAQPCRATQLKLFILLCLGNSIRMSVPETYGASRKGDRLNTSIRIEMQSIFSIRNILIHSLAHTHTNAHPMLVRMVSWFSNQFRIGIVCACGIECDGENAIGARLRWK